MSETLHDLYQDYKTRLADNSDVSDLEARRLIAHYAGFDYTAIIASPDQTVESSKIRDMEAALARRLDGEPLSRILGTQEFWGLEFEISPETLDPRPDTERIVEISVDKFGKKNPRRILDIGTGTGCLLIALLHEFPEAIGVGLDVSEGALAIAQRNADRHNVADRATFVKSSWLESLEPQEFDLIVSNPPYIENHVIPNLQKEVKNHDPILALDGGKDGLQAYRDIFLQLSEGGYGNFLGLFETGYTQGADVSRLSTESGFKVRDVHLDYAGNQRVVEISSGDK